MRVIESVVTYAAEHRLNNTSFLFEAKKGPHKAAQRG
jgi:hypothetical protein